MELVLETVLHDRERDLDAVLDVRRSIALSSLLHILLLSALLIGPLLMQKEPEPIEFTPITIVPVQALGVAEPVAPQQQMQTTPEPRAEPTPPVVEAEPEKPALPAPDATPIKKQAARQEPKSVEPSTATQAESQPGTLGQRRGSPLGSSLGTSAFGAAVGGLDNPDFVYGYYVDQMLAMIGSNWQRPPLGAEIEAVIHFRIHSDGTISDVRILQSSGYNSYDLAGLRAVQLAAPFPKLPQSYRHKSLGVNLILR